MEADLNCARSEVLPRRPFPVEAEVARLESQDRLAQRFSVGRTERDRSVVTDLVFRNVCEANAKFEKKPILRRGKSPWREFRLRKHIPELVSMSRVVLPQCAGPQPSSRPAEHNDEITFQEIVEHGRQFPQPNGRLQTRWTMIASAAGGCRP